MECAQPYLDPVNEIDMIKASIKHAELSQGSHDQCGDEYMVMGPSNTKDGITEKMLLNNGNVTANVDGGDSEDTYVTLH